MYLSELSVLKRREGSTDLHSHMEVTVSGRVYKASAMHSALSAPPPHYVIRALRKQVMHALEQELFQGLQ